LDIQLCNGLCYLEFESCEEQDIFLFSQTPVRLWNSSSALFYHLTLSPLTWRIWWAPNNPSKWQMGFNLAFKGLKTKCRLLYLKPQPVPRCKHFSSRLQKPNSLWCKWHKSLFVLR